MRDDFCEGKQKHDYATAKHIGDAMSKRGKRARPYKCKICDKWHVAAVLTGDLKRVKRLKDR